MHLGHLDVLKDYILPIIGGLQLERNRTLQPVREQLLAVTNQEVHFPCRNRPANDRCYTHMIVLPLDDHFGQHQTVPGARHEPANEIVLQHGLRWAQFTF